MHDPLGTVEVTLPEATDLAGGLVGSTAARLGVSALIVKGRHASEQGLRPVRDAVDVDVLVRGDGAADRLIEALGRVGWRPRPVDPDDAIFPHHSVPLIHSGWPCDIDVHTNFPGCDAPPEVVFDVLWDHRVPAAAAGSSIWIPDLTATALIVALHSLRKPQDSPERSDFVHVVEAAPRLVSGEELVDLARRTRALGALLPFLEQAYPGCTPQIVPPPSEEWILRWTATDSATVRLITLRQASWRERPAMILRALNPSPEALAAVNLEALTADAAGLRRLRRQRLAAAAKRVPHIVREYRAFQREVARQRAQRPG